MTGSLALAALWAVVTQAIALTPSRDLHWRAAYILIALGLPVLVWVFVQHGVWIGLLVLAAAGSVLRWPVLYLGRWLRRTLGRGRA